MYYPKQTQPYFGRVLQADFTFFERITVFKDIFLLSFSFLVLCSGDKKV